MLWIWKLSGIYGWNANAVLRIRRGETSNGRAEWNRTVLKRMRSALWKTHQFLHKDGRSRSCIDRSIERTRANISIIPRDGRNNFSRYVETVIFSRYFSTFLFDIPSRRRIIRSSISKLFSEDFNILTSPNLLLISLIILNFLDVIIKLRKTPEIYDKISRNDHLFSRNSRIPEKPENKQGTKKGTPSSSQSFENNRP